MEKLKIELLQKLRACENIEILKKVERIFETDLSESMVKEEGEVYTKKPTSNLTEEQWEEVERRSQDVKNGKANLIPWEEVRSNLKTKYGF